MIRPLPSLIDGSRYSVTTVASLKSAGYKKADLKDASAGSEKNSSRVFNG